MKKLTCFSIICICFCLLVNVSQAQPKPVVNAASGFLLGKWIYTEDNPHPNIPPTAFYYKFNDDYTGEVQRAVPVTQHDYALDATIKFTWSYSPDDSTLNMNCNKKFGAYVWHITYIGKNYFILKKKSFTGDYAKKELLKDDQKLVKR